MRGCSELSELMSAPPIVGKEVEMSSRKRRLTALGAMGFGGYLMASAMAAPEPGQSVPDGVAAELRGGLCQNVQTVPCPGGGGWWCSYSGNIVVSGTTYCAGTGDNPCGSSCGSFFSAIVPCVKTGTIVAL